MEVALRLAGVSKAFGRMGAVAPLSLDVEKGRTTALIGPSGCGKSTLLRIAIGLVPPDTGVVELEGRAFSPELRREMGYVIQDGGLFPHLSARANVGLMAQYLGRYDEARVRELAALVKLPEAMLDKFPAQLSGGQKQRVSIMRALMLDPDVLLLDEPMGALDPMIRSELQNDLREIFRRLRKTVLLVTHDLAEAYYFSDRIVLMKDGRIVQQGEFHDLVERPAEPFVTAFINAQRILP